MDSIRTRATFAVAGFMIVGPVVAQQAPGGEAARPALPPDGTALVFVNTQAILPVAPGADSAQAQFQVVLRGFEDELAALATEIDSMVTSYRQQQSLLDETGRQQKQQEILAKQQAAQERQQQLEQESNTRRNQLLAPILQNVTDVIEQMRAEHQYAIVFDIAESGVIAADSSLDITAAVLERLGVDPSVASASSGG